MDEEAATLEAESRRLELQSQDAAKMARILRERARQIRAGVGVLESTSLTSDIRYDTNNTMTSSALSIGPSRGPVPDKDGPATKVMKELGFSNLAELAKALDERHGTVRSWNLRDDLPERVIPAVQKLREKQSKRTGRASKA